MKTPILNSISLRMAIVVRAGLLLTANCCPASVISETEPNNSLAAAQSVNGNFSLDYRIDIGDGGFVANTSTSIPHVTVVGSGDGTFDYFSFYAPGTGSGSGQVIFDIDYTSASFDSLLGLWQADGTFLGFNDDYDHRGGAGGSIKDADSLISTYLTTPGTYVVGVARWAAGVGTGGFTGGYPNAEPESSDLYFLQISVEGQTVPEPSALVLLGIGILALSAGVSDRRRVLA